MSVVTTAQVTLKMTTNHLIICMLRVLLTDSVVCMSVVKLITFCVKLRTIIFGSIYIFWRTIILGRWPFVLLLMHLLMCMFIFSLLHLPVTAILRRYSSSFLITKISKWYDEHVKVNVLFYIFSSKITISDCMQIIRVCLVDNRFVRRQASLWLMVYYY